MTSVHTNTGAISALQTLRAVSSDLGKTQSEVSSGFKVSTAADDVAYWSISTTMRSDNLALSAADDAMGVGAAKAATAYEGTDAIIGVLDEFKAKLVTASESSTDKAQIQAELTKLNDQAEAIVNSASFSGVNWLKTNSADHIMDVDVLSDTVVSGFVRDPDNGVSVTTADIDLRRTSMLNAGGGGILQKDLDDYYMPLGHMSNYSYYHNGHEDHLFDGPVTFDAGDHVDFTLVVDRSSESAGDSYSISIDKSVVDDALGTSDGVISDVADFRLVLQKAFANAGADGAVNAYGTHVSASNRYEIQSLETSGNVGSSIYIEDLDAQIAADPGQTLGLDSSSLIDHDNMYSSSTMSFIQPFKVNLDATISFDLSIDNAPLQTYVIDRDSVDAALGTSDGVIGSAEDLKTVILHAAGGDGLDASTSGNQLYFYPDQDVFPGYGNRAVEFQMSSLRTNPPFSLRFDLADIDVTTDTFSVDEYLDGVEHMLERARDSASLIGTMQQRIDLQSSFAGKLSDAIDKGVSRLVDTDMEEASARLSALQTQQQLALQSLQIANSASSVISVLFQ